MSGTGYLTVSLIAIILALGGTGYLTLTFWQWLTLTIGVLVGYAAYNSFSNNTVPEADTITIALDSTSTVAKGILVLPKHKSIYIYSVTWPSMINFINKPENTELENELLALEIFEEYVAAYRKAFSSDKLVMWAFSLNPTTFYLSSASQEGLFKANSRLKSSPFKGEWKRSSGITDWDIQLMRSFTDIDRVTDYIKGHLQGYAVIDLSNHKRSKLNSVAAHIPQGRSIVASNTPASPIRSTPAPPAQNQLGPAVGASRSESDGGDGGDLLKGLALFALTAVTGLAVAGGGYAIYKAVTDENSQTQHQRRRERDDDDEEDDNTITIAVDATPEQGGGLLILPKSKEIFYYAFDWFRVDGYKFPNQSEKFESANALLALKAFESKIIAYKQRYNVSQLICKTDNGNLANFANGMVTFKSRVGKWDPLFDQLKLRLTSYPFANSTWVQASRKVDPYINIADQLSRNDMFTCYTIPRSTIPNDPRSLLFYKDTQIHNGEMNRHFLKISQHLPRHPTNIQIEPAQF